MLAESVSKLQRGSLISDGSEAYLQEELADCSSRTLLQDNMISEQKAVLKKAQKKADEATKVSGQSQKELQQLKKRLTTVEEQIVAATEEVSESKQAVGKMSEEETAKAKAKLADLKAKTAGLEGALAGGDQEWEKDREQQEAELEKLRELMTARQEAKMKRLQEILTRKEFYLSKEKQAVMAMEAQRLEQQRLMELERQQHQKREAERAEAQRQEARRAAAVPAPAARPETFTCTFCKYSSATAEALADHVKVKHPPPPPPYNEALNPKGGELHSPTIPAAEGKAASKAGRKRTPPQQGSNEGSYHNDSEGSLGRESDVTRLLNAALKHTPTTASSSPSSSSAGSPPSFNSTGLPKPRSRREPEPERDPGPPAREPPPAPLPPTAIAVSPEFGLPEDYRPLPRNTSPSTMEQPRTELLLPPPAPGGSMWSVEAFPSAPQAISSSDWDVVEPIGAPMVSGIGPAHLPGPVPAGASPPTRPAFAPATVTSASRTGQLVFAYEPGGYPIYQAPPPAYQEIQVASAAKAPPPPPPSATTQQRTPSYNANAAPFVPGSYAPAAAPQQYGAAYPTPAVVPYPNPRQRGQRGQRNAAAQHGAEPRHSNRQGDSWPQGAAPPPPPFEAAAPAKGPVLFFRVGEVQSQQWKNTQGYIAQLQKQVRFANVEFECHPRRFGAMSDLTVAAPSVQQLLEIGVELEKVFQMIKLSPEIRRGGQDEDDVVGFVNPDGGFSFSEAPAVALPTDSPPPQPQPPAQAHATDDSLHEQWVQGILDDLEEEV